MPADLQKQVEHDAIANAQNFSLDKMCEQTIRVYQELL
jgi:hypothetical protein